MHSPFDNFGQHASPRCTHQLFTLAFCPYVAQNLAGSRSSGMTAASGTSSGPRPRPAGRGSGSASRSSSRKPRPSCDEALLKSTVKCDFDNILRTLSISICVQYQFASIYQTLIKLTVNFFKFAKLCLNSGRNLANMWQTLGGKSGNI